MLCADKCQVIRLKYFILMCAILNKYNRNQAIDWMRIYISSRMKYRWTTIEKLKYRIIQGYWNIPKNLLRQCIRNSKTEFINVYSRTDNHFHKLFWNFIEKNFPWLLVCFLRIKVMLQVIGRGWLALLIVFQWCVRHGELL